MSDEKVPPMTPPIVYVPGFVVDPGAAFFELCRSLDWERREDVPRSEYYANDHAEPYAYGRGKGRRVYHPKPWHPLMLEIRSRLEQLTTATLDVCFANLYLDSSDQLGWHADDSPEMDDTRPIVTVSLGAQREIMFRKISDRGRSVSYKLGNGSCCIMQPGMQNEWEHRIPKATFECGPRISLTYRGFIDPRSIAYTDDVAGYDGLSFKDARAMASKSGLNALASCIDGYQFTVPIEPDTVYFEVKDGSVCRAYRWKDA
jgi:alkylated DNA repair dioxygenase AlkB